MSKGYRTGGEGESVSAFDISALLNFMYRCRLADEYILDFSNVKKVIEVSLKLKEKLLNVELNYSFKTKRSKPCKKVEN